MGKNAGKNAGERGVIAPTAAPVKGGGVGRGVPLSQPEPAGPGKDQGQGPSSNNPNSNPTSQLQEPVPSVVHGKSADADGFKLSSAQARKARQIAVRLAQEKVNSNSNAPKLRMPPSLERSRVIQCEDGSPLVLDKGGHNTSNIPGWACQFFQKNGKSWAC